jgi:hypothetical protein
MTDREPDERVFVSCAAQQPHAVLTHASLANSVLILRMPEFVATKTGGDELSSIVPLSGKRMTGWRVTPGATAADAVSERLMIRQPRGDSDLVIGIATDIADSVSSNHQFWPSCIHSNPGWKELAPGEKQTARGKVYIFHGTKDEMLDRYRRDFD